jgi:hypothetical protein
MALANGFALSGVFQQNGICQQVWCHYRDDVIRPSSSFDEFYLVVFCVCNFKILVLFFTFKVKEVPLLKGQV